MDIAQEIQLLLEDRLHEMWDDATEDPTPVITNVRGFKSGRDFKGVIAEFSDGSEVSITILCRPPS